MQNAHGEIIIYQAEDGQTKLQVHLEKESVWLTQAQLTELFDRNKRTISEHIRNVFKEGELVENAVVRKFRTTASDGKSYDVIYYNLDVIISVGYRVKSQRGTQFRIWATTVLKEHLIKGYTVSERRLAEKGLSEMEQTIALLSNTLERREVLSEEGKAILEVVSRYAKSWSLLLQYDEDRLALPKSRHPAKQSLEYGQTKQSIKALKDDLLARGEAAELFGRSGIIISRVFSATSTRPSMARTFMPAWKKRRPTCFTLSSRTTHSAMATNGSAFSSSWFSCRRTICWNNPALMTTGWWPWPY